MSYKRMCSALLAGVLLLGLMTAPAHAAGRATFTDLTDTKEAECVEFLHVMGVVHGDPGGAYRPGGTLTRAEFCKMAVAVLDRTDEEPSHRGRTIYPDVGSRHWARGYINLASSISLGGEDGTRGAVLVGGMGDGTFQPDRAITYGEAVAILCRILGYSGTEIATGGAWYDGYLAAGASSGLTEGLSLGGGDVITRGQAATLFYNMYFSKPKGSSNSYMVSLGGSEINNSIITDVNAEADDGSAAVETSHATYGADRYFDPAVEGQEGKLILDADGRLVAFVAKSGTSRKVIHVVSTEATYLVASGGTKVTVEPDTKVYRDGGSFTWREAYLNVTPGSSVVFHYGANGKLSHIFLGSASVDGVDSMVARTVPTGGNNPFATLAGGGTYTMFKNGMVATAGDIRQYDVATWDAGTRTIRVSDLKLTGIYENADPSMAAPVTVTLMGHAFPVLSSAREDLASFKVGDRITLLLTADNQVAGAVSANVAQGEAVGLATVSESGYATVKLLQNGLVVKGNVSGGSAAERYNNQLVTVTGSGTDTLSLSVVASSAVRGSLDVAGRTLGGRAVADNVVVYDRVKNGIMVPIHYSDLCMSTIPAGKISFVSYDYAGRVQYIVLHDATGDAYTYGYLGYSTETETPSDATTKPGSSSFNKDPYEVHYAWIRQADSHGKEITTDKLRTLDSFSANAVGGLAVTADGKMAVTVTLQSLTGVRRSAFDPQNMTVTVAGVSYPIAEDVQCYNKSTKSWFIPGKTGIEAARAYSDSLNLYYDRAPEEGGKIRIIIVP